MINISVEEIFNEKGAFVSLIQLATLTRSYE